MENTKTYYLTVTLDSSQTDITRVMNHIRMNAEIVKINLMCPLSGKQLKAKAVEEGWNETSDAQSPIDTYAAGFQDGYLKALKS